MNDRYTLVVQTTGITHYNDSKEHYGERPVNQAGHGLQERPAPGRITMRKQQKKTREVILQRTRSDQRYCKPACGHHQP